MKCFYAGHAFKLTCKASSAAHNGQSDFVNASPNHKWCNSLIFDMHYVMAQESDEVRTFFDLGFRAILRTMLQAMLRTLA